MAVKTWEFGYQTGSDTPHIVIVRVSDGKYWDGTDWTSSETLLGMAEEFAGFWTHEVTAAWPNDTVRWVIYAGNSSGYNVLAAGSVRVVDDALVEGALQNYLTAVNAVRPVQQEMAKLRNEVKSLRDRLTALIARLTGTTQIGN